MFRDSFWLRHFDVQLVVVVIACHGASVAFRSVQTVPLSHPARVTMTWPCTCAPLADLAAIDTSFAHSRMAVLSMGACNECLQGYGTNVVHSLVSALGDANVRIVDIRNWPSTEGAIHWDDHVLMPPVFEYDITAWESVEAQLVHELLMWDHTLLKQIEMYPVLLQGLLFLLL